MFDAPRGGRLRPLFHLLRHQRRLPDHPGPVVGATSTNTEERDARGRPERAHTMLRRYLMIALGTYRAGGTVCHHDGGAEEPEPGS